MKKNILIILLFSLLCYSQSRNSNWCFGDSVGIKFINLSNPANFITGMDCRGSCCSISDTSGNLLFYAINRYEDDSSVFIFNYNHQIMQNGSRICGAGLYNDIIVIPIPGDSSRYYLFHEGRYSTQGFYYTIVDNSLNNGLGAVVSENLIEKTGAAITIVEDCSGINFTCNTMSRCYTGVYLDSNGVANIITDQGALSGIPTSWNNKWENMQNANGYKVMGTVDPTIIAYWFYDVNQTSEYSPVPIEPSLATNIISQPCSTTTSLCDPPSQIIMMAMRDNVYGDAVGDSAYFVEIEPEFLYNRKQSFYKAAVDDTSLLNLGATNDQVYIEAYDSLHETNIGNLVATDTLVAKHDYSNATARLNSLVYPNTIEENHKYALQIYMDNYGMGIKPDSAILVEMDAKAHQHAFFGGTGIYLLRGMLHLDIEDQLPQLRRMQKGTIVIPPAIQQNFFGKLFPNPSSDQVNYICKINNGEKIELAVQNSMNETILHLQLVNELTTFNTKYLSPGIYYYLILINNQIKDKGKLIINR